MPLWGLRPQPSPGAGSTSPWLGLSGTLRYPQKKPGKPCDRCHGPGCCGGGQSRHTSPGPSGLQAAYERQGIAVMTPTVPGSPKGPFLGLPRGTMRRQKSIGKQHGRTCRGCPALPEPQQPPSAPPTFGQMPGLTRWTRNPWWLL